ncbi:TPA: hypothetical protein N0F65_002896 [Lagenidium giganteum]|uniref:Potassium channel domain-containing protein n=1 Tax=Lagenidium giganteum TaxID=4803 RepID=A0AAV2Z970_9STRA|nr:TPA: hypothetical protein N0F65_002896 [Lagenidium giganteum]
MSRSEQTATETAMASSMGRREQAEYERREIAQHVEEEHFARVGSLRTHSSYLPPAHKNQSEHLRLAQRSVDVGPYSSDAGCCGWMLLISLLRGWQAVYGIHQRYELRRKIENVSFALAMASIGLIFADNEYVSSDDGEWALRIVNCVISVLLILLVLWRFVVNRDILIKRNVLPPHESVWRSPKLVFNLLLELLVCGVVVPPGVHGTFEVWEWKFYVLEDTRACPAPYTEFDGSCYLRYAHRYEVIGLVALLRLYMVPRLILNLSDFTNYRTAYLGTLYHVDTGSSLFALKCFLRTHQFRLLAGAFLSTLVITGYAVSIVESPIDPELASLWNSLWLVVLAMSTVGYGDLYPETFAGQTLLVLGGMLAGILLFSVWNATISNFLGLEEKDWRFLHLLRHQRHQQTVKHASARSIQVAWKLYHAKQTGLDKARPRKFKQLHQALFKRTSEQRILRRHSVGEYSSLFTEAHSCQDQLMVHLRQSHQMSIKRLVDMEKRLDQLLSQLSAAA